MVLTCLTLLDNFIHIRTLSKHFRLKFFFYIYFYLCHLSKISFPQMDTPSEQTAIRLNSATAIIYNVGTVVLNFEESNLQPVY